MIEYALSSVIATIHENRNHDKYIRIVFRSDEGDWLYAFNPTWVSAVEWEQRSDPVTGKQFVCSRYPVQVSFARPTDHDHPVEVCSLHPCGDAPHNIQAADAYAIAAIEEAAVLGK